MRALVTWGSARGGTEGIARITFGGRLAADAKRFPAAAMARTHAGDWRQPSRVRCPSAQARSS
jgi:hypothetical protein